MIMAEKKTRTREKKQRTGKKHLSLKVWEYYEVEGNAVKRKRKNCPRCGPGTMLSEHKNRFYCGRCGYTQIQKDGMIKPSAESAKPPEVKQEVAAEGKPAEAEKPEA